MMAQEHRDEDVSVHLPRPHAEVQLASVIALVDFTAAIGATVVAPGSHRWESDRWPAPEDLTCAAMPAFYPMPSRGCSSRCRRPRPSPCF